LWFVHAHFNSVSKNKKRLEVRIKRDLFTYKKRLEVRIKRDLFTNTNKKIRSKNR